MIRAVLQNRCRFGTRPFLNVPLSARSFSSQNAAPLLVNPSNVTKDAIFVDASWHMPNSPRKAPEEFLKKRLPRARFLDLDEVAREHELGLKHMIPDPEVFAKFCGKYAIYTSLPATFSPAFYLRLKHSVAPQNVLESREPHPLSCNSRPIRFLPTFELTSVPGMTPLECSPRLELSSCSVRSVTQIRACLMVVFQPGNLL